MTEPLIALSESVWGDIAGVCANLTDAQWERPTDCPGWTVQDNVAHMIGTERMLLGEQPDAPPVDEPAAHIRNDIGKVNEQWISGYRGMRGAEVLDAFRAVTQRRLAAMNAMTDDDWNKEGFTPEGPGPYRQFMAIRVFDCWYHDQDIREAIEVPGCLEGPVADMSLARIPVKGLPYVVGKKAGAPPDTTVVFDVAGEPPMLSTVRVPPEGRAVLLDAPPASPTVTLGFDRRTFARLAGGRWTGAQARTQGVVRVDGDKELGKRVVDNMAFTL